jgi:hypothetical protein
VRDGRKAKRALSVLSSTRPTKQMLIDNGQTSKPQALWNA